MTVFSSEPTLHDLCAQDTPRSYGVAMSADDIYQSKLSCQIAIRDGDDYLWVDVTDDVRGLEWDRGATEPYTQPEVGTAQVTVDNRTSKYSAWNTTVGTFAGTDQSLILPHTPMRFGVTIIDPITSDEDWLPFFTGRVETYDEGTNDNTDSYVTFGLVDIAASLAAHGNGIKMGAGPGALHAWIEGDAIALPLVIGGSNNKLKLSADTYTIASGTYTTLAGLATALGAAVDGFGSPFSALVTPTVTTIGLLLTVVATGSSSLVLNSGATDDVLTYLNFTGGTAFDTYEDIYYGSTGEVMLPALLADIEFPFGYDDFVTSIDPLDPFWTDAELQSPERSQNRLQAAQDIATSCNAMVYATSSGRIGVIRFGPAVGGSPNFGTFSNAPTGDQFPIVELTPYASTDRILNSITGQSAQLTTVQLEVIGRKLRTSATKKTDATVTSSIEHDDSTGTATHTASGNEVHNVGGAQHVVAGQIIHETTGDYEVSASNPIHFTGGSGEQHTIDGDFEIDTTGSLKVNGVPIDGGAFISTTAGGDLAGTYPDPTIGTNKVVTAKIADSNVTLAKLANIADARILGNNTGGAAAPVALTAAQVKTLLAIANTDVSGLGTASTHAATDFAPSSGIAESAVTGLVSDLAGFSSDIALKADIASPAFTGHPTGVTESAGNNSTRLATTAYADTGLALKAPLASPALTGHPTGVTESAGDNSTRLASTAYVDTADALKAPLASPTFTGHPVGVTESALNNSTRLATTAYADAAVTAGRVPLAIAQYAPATLATYALTNVAMTALDTTNLTLPFTVPASGKVIIMAQAEVQLNTPSSSGGIIAAGLLNHSGGAQVGFNVHPLGWGVASVSGQIATVPFLWYLTGLTPGAIQLDFACAFSTSTGCSGWVYACGYTGNVNGAKTSPFTMIAYPA